MFRVIIIGCGTVGYNFGTVLEGNKLVNVTYVDKDLNVVASTKKCVTPYNKLYKEIDIAIISVPTEYDEKTGLLDCSKVEEIIDDIVSYNQKCIIVIKSTVYVGFTERKDNDNILYCPEFLRENYALYDSMFPSRMIIGHKDTENGNNVANIFGTLMRNTIQSNYDILYSSYKEAEAIKLFSNAYLATRVAFFNEVDTFATKYGCDSYKLIKGICLDNRIGNYYNQPSVGFGGKCLPKDIACIKTQTESPLFSGVIESNENRKKYFKNA